MALEQEALLRQIQIESDSVRSKLIEDVKDYIKAYGKKQGYDYIYGTGDAATVLYAKDGYDITEEILKQLNDEFKASNGGSEEKTEATETKEEEKK